MKHTAKLICAIAVAMVMILSLAAALAAECEHEIVISEAIPPTCCNSGMTEEQFCILCGTVLVQREEIPADPNAHAPQLQSVLKEATCTTDGVGLFNCRLCDVSLGYMAIPAGHTWEISMILREPTCTSEGTVQRTCTMCSASEFTSVPPTGEHVWVESYRAATCTEPGVAGRVCEVCGAIGEDAVIIEDPLGHVFAGEEFVEANCQHGAGVVSYCMNCEAESFMEFDADHVLYQPATEHSLEVMKGVAPTCSSTGMTEWVRCAACGLEIEKPEVLPVNPEAHVAVVVEVVKEPTCTSVGTARCVCEMCGVDLGYQEIEASHNWTSQIIKEATCSSDGLMNRTCTLCGMKESIVLPSTGHVLEEMFMDATCTDPAYVAETCIWCKIIVKTWEVEGTYPLGHKWVIGKEATCTSNGVRLCTVCAMEESIPAAHKWMTIKESPATCISDGFRNQMCSVCGKSESVLLKSTGEEHVFAEKVWFNNEDGVLSRLDENNHTFMGLVHVDKVCEFCGKSESVVEERTVTAPHEFIADDENGCGCACGEKGHNPEYIIESFTYSDEAFYHYKNPGYHIQYRDLAYGSICNMCWEPVDVEWLNVEVEARTEKHTFENGACIDCGGAEVAWTCEHLDQYAYMEKASSEYIVMNNPEYHVSRVGYNVQYFCDACDEFMGEEPDVFYTYEKSNHYGDIVCQCGYKFTCSHENVIQNAVQDSGIMFWAQKNDTHHQYYGNLEYEYVCADCGTWLDQGDGFVSGKEGIEEEHTMCGSICVFCGYRENGVLFCESGVMYVVPGVKFWICGQGFGTNALGATYYASSNDSVVTGTNDGKLLAVGEGVAEITFSANGYVPAECFVYVVPAMDFPDNTYEIKAEAFAGSAVRAVDLSDCNGVIIGDNAFANCGSLACVVLPDEAKIADNAFDAGSLITFYCPNEEMAETITQMGHTAVMLG